MPIIPPSRDFEGSAVEDSSFGHIRSDIRQIQLSKKTNGVSEIDLFILPPYRIDHAGKGAWFKQYKTRSFVGVGTSKLTYYIQDPAKDPCLHFEHKFQQLYPERAKPVEVPGEKYKQYPPYGKLNLRCVYNTAKCRNPEQGTHVLPLPVHGGHKLIDAHHRSKTYDGKETPLINEPNRCVPITLSLGEGMNPYQMKFHTEHATQLPEVFTNSDYLYNLDDIFIIVPKDDIIQRLREGFNSKEFAECMSGYEGFAEVVRGVSFPAQTSNPVVTQPMVNPLTPFGFPVNPALSAAAPAPAVANKFAFPANLQPPKATMAPNQPTNPQTTTTPEVPPFVNPMANVQLPVPQTVPAEGSVNIQTPDDALKFLKQ